MKGALRNIDVKDLLGRYLKGQLSSDSFTYSLNKLVGNSKSDLEVVPAEEYKETREKLRIANGKNTVLHTTIDKLKVVRDKNSLVKEIKELKIKLHSCKTNLCHYKKTIKVLKEKYK